MLSEIEHPTPSSPRERILAAVIDCIERDGINNLTTRAIARQAGTNIASINYYFRSKEALVAEALQMSLNHMLQDIRSLIEDRHHPLMEILNEIFLYLVDGTVRFPGISMADLYSALVEKDYDSPGAQAMRQLFEWIVGRLFEAYPQKKPETVRVMLYQTFASILFTMIAPGLFRVSMPVDFASPEDRRAYVAYLCEALQASIEAS